jgi:predicted sugar kinase
VRRYALTHTRKDDWVFVLVMPRVPRNTPADLEARRTDALLRAFPLVDQAALQRVTGELLAALDANNLDAFAQALMLVQQLNQDALARSMQPLSYSSGAQTVLRAVQEWGALAWGGSPSGLALYALVAGAQASIDLRQHLRPQLGAYGGLLAATITDNQGARALEPE